MACGQWTIGWRAIASFGTNAWIAWKHICRSCRPRTASKPARRASVAEKSNIDLGHDPAVMIGTRVLDAPRTLVFDMWSDPKHLAQWWGPDGFTTTTSAFDLRPGGVWSFVTHGPDGRDYQNRIVFE